MTHISEALYELLMRDGLRTKPPASGRVRGMKGTRRSHDGAAGRVMANAAGEPQRPTAGGGNLPMRIPGKGRGAVKAPPVVRGKRQRPVGKGEPLLTLVADNAGVMPTRQGAIRRTPSLLCIIGGKL